MKRYWLFILILAIAFIFAASSAIAEGHGGFHKRDHNFRHWDYNPGIYGGFGPWYGYPPGYPPNNYYTWPYTPSFGWEWERFRHGHHRPWWGHGDRDGWLRFDRWR
jgi:hypothetical protein